MKVCWGRFSVVVMVVYFFWFSSLVMVVIFDDLCDFVFEFGDDFC